MVTEIKAFKCDHCGKLYSTKCKALNHEEGCRSNPKNQGGTPWTLNGLEGAEVIREYEVSPKLVIL